MMEPETKASVSTGSPKRRVVQFFKSDMTRMTVYIDSVGKILFALALLFPGLGFAQELVEPPAQENRSILDEALKARQRAELSLDAVGRRKQVFEKTPYTDRTSQQIQKQIQSMSNLERTMGQVRDQREKRLGDLKTEIELLLLEIKRTNDAKHVRRSSTGQENRNSSSGNNTKRIPQTGNGMNNSLNEGNAGSGQNAKLVKRSKPETLSPNEERPDPQMNDNLDPQLRKLTREPVDRLALANNLVAIESYDTAIGIYLDLLAAKSLKAGDQNWVHYQLARCYRRQMAFPEAERHLREAANSSKREIAGQTAIWWLDQVKNQRALSESLNQMKLTLADLEEEYDGNR